MLDRKRQQPIEFLVLQHVRFTGGTGHHQRLRATGQLVVEQSTEGREIERAIGRKRCRQSADASTNVQGPIPLQIKPYMLLAGSRGGQVSSIGVISRFPQRAGQRHRQVLLKPSSGSSSTAARAGNDNQLLIQALTPAIKSPLLALAKRIADAGCNLSESRVSTIGTEISLMLLASGAWDALAKLETALTKLARDESLRLVHYRTGPRENSSHLLPYLVEVVAADRPGIVVRIVEFFSQHGISVEQLNSTRYQAMQTGAEMFQAQFTIGIPAEIHIAALRDDFLELCDGLNLDAMMDPVKF